MLHDPNINTFKYVMRLSFGAHMTLNRLIQPLVFNLCYEYLFFADDTYFLFMIFNYYFQLSLTTSL